MGGPTFFFIAKPIPGWVRRTFAISNPMLLEIEEVSDPPPPLDPRLNKAGSDETRHDLYEFKCVQTSYSKTHDIYMCMNVISMPINMEHRIFKNGGGGGGGGVKRNL